MFVNIWLIDLMEDININFWLKGLVINHIEENLFIIQTHLELIIALGVLYLEVMASCGYYLPYMFHPPLKYKRWNII